jgi:hypothetical protein
MKQPTFTLPADDYIDVRSVPELLAAAKYPDLGQPQQVTGLGKRMGRATLELDDADKATLRNAWQPLPWPVFPLDVAAWQPYADALAASSSPPPWALVTFMDDVRFGESMLRIIACEEYQKAMEAAMDSGTLEWRSELTLLPVQPGSPLVTSAFANGGFVVSRVALKGFAEGAGFKVHRERAVTSATAPTGYKAKMAAAKAAAHELWKQWTQHGIQGLTLRRNEDVAAECVKRWPILKQSTITQKWMPQWSRERRASSK